MKTHIKNLFHLPALITGLGVMLAGQAAAQTFTTLYSFTALNNFGANSDGAGPTARLVLSGNTLYGTALYGGWVDGGYRAYGTVFALNTNGTGFTTLYNFTGDTDGANPSAGLILSGDTLYGTAERGGSEAAGSVFAVNTDGTGFRTVHSLDGSDGDSPSAGLVLSGNTLYGTAYDGGRYVVGSSGYGTVFAVNTDGTDFTPLYSFTPCPGPLFTNSDGDHPSAGLVLSGNTLYGTAYAGGSLGHGTVFAVNTNGTGFTTLHSFTGGSDGAVPYAGLILSGNTLYGTAEEGGISTNGTVFAVNTDGTGFTTLYTFSNGSDGGSPAAGLVLSANTLYGTAYAGGSSGSGTVFSLTLPPVTAPQLTITPSGASVILTWPAAGAGFTLQSTTNLGSLAFWTTNSPAPVVVNGQNVVTNPLAGAQQFFRLSQ